jgi:hypothetical protein
MGHTRRVLADVHLRFQCDDILVGKRVGVLAPTPTFSIVLFRARIDTLAHNDRRISYASYFSSDCHVGADRNDFKRLCSTASNKLLFNGKMHRDV